ncbi:bL21 family ribosomal protein, partial [Roseiarcus sp.]|uniref:bL21 family ribosomal protein n=1 Tax=Roseiarcus sp. TaxID=1969460 RepID=UPI003C69F5C8
MRQAFKSELSPAVLSGARDFGPLQRSRPRGSPRNAPGGTREKTMFAVIKTGGKQYTVAAEKKITVMSLPGEAG